MCVVDQVRMEVDSTAYGSILWDREAETVELSFHFPAQFLGEVNTVSRTQRKWTYRSDLKTDGPGNPLREILNCHIWRITQVAVEISSIALEDLEDKGWSGLRVSGRHRVPGRHDNGEEKEKGKEVTRARRRGKRLYRTCRITQQATVGGNRGGSVYIPKGR